MHVLKPKKRVVVLFSSGLDSLVNLVILKELYKFEPILLFIDYNQKAKELEFEKSEAVAKYYKLPLVIKKLNIELGSKLTGGKLDTMIATNDEREAPVDLVPYRNILFAYQGIVLARQLSAQYVAFGFNISEAGTYPDNTPRFLDALNNLFISSTYYPYERIIRFISASIHFTKTELVMLGKYLNVDFSLSNSCYYPIHGKACGQCASCKFRLEAFKRAKVKDAIEYFNMPIAYKEEPLDLNKIAELLDVINREKAKLEEQDV